VKASAKLRMWLRSKEMLRPDVYDDGGGVPTQGYGHTGPDVRFGGPPIDQAQAELWFHADVSVHEREVERLVTVQLTQGMFDCLVSFDFNSGGLEFVVNGKVRQSRVLVAVNERRWNDAVEELVTWNQDGGKDRRGLLTRRLEEGLFFTSERYPA